MVDKKVNLKEQQHPRKKGVVLEDIYDKLDIVIEGQEGLQKQIDRNHGEFREFREETNMKFEAVFEEFKAMDNKIEDKTNMLLERVINIEGEKVSHTEFDLLENRVEAFERRKG